MVVAAATLGTAAAVSVSGLIGFVGIIVPHAIRLVTDSSYRGMMPVSIMVGAAFLILADLVARTVLSRLDPPGVVTALLGAPFFLGYCAQAARRSELKELEPTSPSASSAGGRPRRGGTHGGPGRVGGGDGANGAGKTTLIRAVVAHLDAHQGTVGIAGRATAELRRRRAGPAGGLRTPAPACRTT